MNFFDQNTIWVILGVLLLGVILGGKVVLSIMRIMGGFMRQPMHRYPPHGEYEPLPPTTGGNDGCLIYIVVLIVGVIFIRNVANNELFKDIFKPEKESGIPIQAPQEANPGFTEQRTTDVPSATKTIPASDVVTIEAQEEELPEEEIPVIKDPHIIQVGSFYVWDNAVLEMERFANKGVRTVYYIVQKEDGSESYNVCLGPYSTLDDTKIVQKELHVAKGIIRKAEEFDLKNYDGR